MSSAAARQTRRFARKREEILDAAARLFNTKSLKGTTLADVAQSVDLITTSLTYYYRRKEDLAAACYDQTLAAIGAVADEAAAQAAPEARVRAFCDRYFAMLSDIARGERPELVNFYELRAFAGPQREPLFNCYVDLFKRMRRIVRDDARLSRQQVNARTHLFFSVILWARTWVRQYEDEDYARVGARLADLLLHGLGDKTAFAPRLLGVAGQGAASVSEPGPDAFLHAATLLINEQGYHGASVEKISARLNVTKGSFYHHLEAKDDLVAECFERSFAAIRRTQHAAMALDASGWTRLSAAVAELVLFQLSEEGPLLHYMALAAAPDSMREGLAANMQRLTNRFAGMIADGVADGSVRPVDPAIAAQVVNGMVNAAADLARWAPGATLANAVDLYARPLFAGLLEP
ncbi:MAG: TetR/AcrR family transcriptional regulator [Hyphomonadaceae bacterium]|nr:TetR/AcrR family transcriptional regulator [Hyphomonadaceae bacterium]